MKLLPLEPFSSAGGAVDEVGEIESAEIEGHTLAASAGLRASGKSAGESRSTACAAGAGVGLGGRGIDVVGVEADLIVNLALLGIAEDVVRLGERLEFFLGGLVPGINVGVVLARELAKCLANVVGGGGLLHAEDFVIIFLGGCCHLESWRRLLAAHKRGRGRPRHIFEYLVQDFAPLFIFYHELHVFQFRLVHIDGDRP